MRPTIRELLEAAGYAVMLQVGGWTRCAVSRGKERWTGHGFDTDDALDHALAQMFPSHLARVVLASALAAPQPALELQTPIQQPVASDRGVAERKPTPAAAPSSAATVVETASKSTAREVRVTRAREADALRDLAGLLHHIDYEEPAFAVLAPDRQRLLESLWISRARAHAEAADSNAVQASVEEIARRLNELAKAYYPGNVRALQLAARPADTQAGTRPPSQSWSEAATATQQALDALSDAGRAAGLDSRGWADVEPMDPAPERADDVARAAAEEIDAVAPPGAPADLEERAVARLVSAACCLRWVRPWVSDRVRWGRAIGRLRALVGALGPRAEGLREVIDPRYRPERPWLALAPPSAGSGARPGIALGAVPSAPAALARWIVECFDVAETVDIVEALRERAADVLALGDRDLPTQNRKVVRRFREVQRLLAKTAAA